MRLNALRIRSTTESHPQLWRMSPGSGSATNIICFEADPSEIERIRSALGYVLDNQAIDGFAEVAVHISDNAGTNWIVERTPARARILRNGQHLQDADAMTQLTSALLDKETSDADVPTQILNALEITCAQDGMTITPAKSYVTTSKMKLMAERRVNDLTKECARILGQPSLTDPVVMVELGNQLEPLYAGYKEVQRQYQELINQNTELAKYDIRNLEKLSDEVEMIEEISDVASPLLQPSASPQHLREKLTRIEADMSTALHACGLPDFLPTQQNQIPWAKMVGALSKKYACQKLLESFEQTRRKLVERVQPSFQEYLRIVESLLASDKQITAELETCLSTLSLQVSQAEMPVKPVEENKFASLIHKFIKHETPQTPEPSKAQVCATKLEDARLSVDHALARLGELHSDVACAKEDYEKGASTVQSVHEAITREHGQLQAHWEQLARTYGLPADYDINLLLKLIASHAQIAQLHQEREAIRATVKQHRLTLAHLETLVLNWRTKTGSQKDVQLTNPALVISEAQSIIRYRSEKQEQLAKLQAVHEQLRVHHLLKTHVENRALEVRRNWNKVFHTLGLQPLPENHREWSGFFKNSRTIATVNALVHEEGAPMSGDKMFSALTSEMPLTLYTSRTQPIPSTSKLAILMRLENATATNLQIVLTNDAELASGMRKLGCGNARRAENPGKQGVGATTKTSSDISAPTRVMSERASAALNVLTNRAGK